ncbi:helix-turn-helix domain-containing protein [Roseomonas mucosa]|uniref:hypothetical protein n=1 Tax=Roseomonas mucosa TaxID=207340 RepID=UPI002B406739|nr:hypothetical protein [Roseomonas mucosa]QDD96931.1 Transcriptional regulator, ArsR family [Roseomonas mucosa]
MGDRREAADRATRLRAALTRPLGVGALARACDAGPAEAALLLLELCAGDRVRPYCQDLVIRSDCVAGLRDGPATPEWPASRRIAAALPVSGGTSLADLEARTALPPVVIAAEVEALVRLGAAERGPQGTWRRGGMQAPTPSQRRALVRMVARGAILAEPARPISSVDLARALGLRPARMNDLLQAMLRRGEVSHLGYGLYTATGNRCTGLAALPAPCGGNSRTRGRRVGDAILAFLSEPRQAGEIAGHVGRSISNVTGHLRALQASGEVVRLGWGRYALASTSALPPADLRRPGGRPHLAAVARDSVS